MGWIKRAVRSVKKAVSKTPMGQQLGINAPKKHGGGGKGGYGGKSIVNTARQGGGGHIKFRTEIDTPEGGVSTPEAKAKKPAFGKAPANDGLMRQLQQRDAEKARRQAAKNSMV